MSAYLELSISLTRVLRLLKNSSVISIFGEVGGAFGFYTVEVWKAFISIASAKSGFVILVFILFRWTMTGSKYIIAKPVKAPT